MRVYTFVATTATKQKQKKAWMFTFLFIPCICTTCVPGTSGGQKRTSNSLELELWMIETHHIGAGIVPLQE